MLEQLERPEIEERQYEPRLVTTAPPAPEADHRQRRRMVVALILLLVALGLVLVKDRDFWFPDSPEAADSEAVDNSQPSEPAEAVNPPAVQPAAVSPTAPATHKSRPVTAAKRQPQPRVETQPVTQATTPFRAVLPPLQVEVYAGGRQQLPKPGSPSVSIDTQSGGLVPPAAAATIAPNRVTSASSRVEMSASQPFASHPAQPAYPLLARQMEVQGKVVLDARIGLDGGVQALNVVGGPSILADAAQEAVKQWRFKPYYVDGQPAESEARVTVDFKIRRD